MQGDDFISKKSQKKRHNFLKHYYQGKIIAFEGRPIDVYTNAPIKIYDINSTEHADYWFWRSR